MNSETVDLIATDPPFNKGRDFHTLPDQLGRGGGSFQDRWSWDQDVHPIWVDQITDDYPKLIEAIESARYAHSDSMGAYMCFMAVRIIEMHRILKPTGSLFLHCDPTASHYLKATLDAIFGYKNFRNEIVWCYTDPAGRRNSGYYKRTHDLIFWYTKDFQNCKIGEIHLAPLSESTLKRYGPYFDANGQITYDHLKKTNPGVFASLKGRPEDLSEVWMDKNKGTTGPDWWVDFTPIRRKGGKQRAREPHLWPTQKPLELYARLITSATNQGDMVLDPFAGCATTCVAAEQQNRQWVGIDIWEKTYEIVLDRMEHAGLTSDSGESLSDQARLFAESFHWRNDVPVRDDNGEEAASFLQVAVRYPEPDGPAMTRVDMYEHLIQQNGQKCQGCNREFDDKRYLELDHNTPRSDGGMNHITNRVLLCGPCNKLKSNTYTLSGLIKENRRLGYMR